MPVKLKTKTTKPEVATEVTTEVKEEIVKAGAQVTAEAPVEEVNNAILGSLSEKLHFICCLGDPSVPDKTPLKDGSARIDPTIVGFKFKADVDLDIPDCPPGEDFKNNLMSYTGDPLNTKHVKAGEEFMLTKFETGVLVSREEFNGKVLGGERQCVCVYTKTPKMASNGAVTVSGAAALPSVSLRALKGSIKDYKMEEVLTFTKTTAEGTGISKINRQIKPGYEKFVNLTIASSRNSGGRGGSSSTVGATNKRNEAAQTFLNIVNARAKKAK